MKIILDNIGPLKHVEMDMSKGLIVLCGPNNTGKTYAAYAVYNVYRQNKLIERQYEDISNELYVTGRATINLENLIKKHRNEIIALYQKEVSDNLYVDFSTHKSFFEKSKITIDVSEDECLKLVFEMELQENIGIRNGNISITKKIESFEIVISFQPIDNTDYSNILTSALVVFTTNLLLEQLFHKTYISTAERNSINLFGRELTASSKWLENKNNQDLIERIRKIKENRPFIPPYNRPILDSLTIADNIPLLKKQSSDFAFFADEIEQRLLGGKIKVSEDGETVYVPNKNGKNGGYGLHISASIVKSLSGLVFYFRHLAQKGDFIIIDEPELSLHPDNQRMMARILAKAVNLGFKVMFSTHSDYIIRELNNLIMLEGGKQKSKKLIKKYGYQTEELVAAENVGVYLFKPNAVESLDVTEAGFSVDTIDAEISKLNETSEDIYNTLFD